MNSYSLQFEVLVFDYIIVVFPSSLPGRVDKTVGSLVRCHLRSPEHLKSLWLSSFASSIVPSPSWEEFNQFVINQKSVSPDGDGVVLGFTKLSSLSLASTRVHPVDSWRI